jgi:hypothetical protein
VYVFIEVFTVNRRYKRVKLIKICRGLNLNSGDILPVKGYDSVNLPSGLYAKVKALVKARSDLGYRSVTEFVAESVRKRTEELERINNLKMQLEENFSSKEFSKEDK